MRKRINRGLKLVNEFYAHDMTPTTLGQFIVMGLSAKNFDKGIVTVKQYVRVPRICNIHNKNHK